MLKVLKIEFTELLNAKSLSEYWDEIFDVFHVSLLYVTKIIRIPILSDIIPSFARYAAIKCARRYYDTGCIRNLPNCLKPDHICHFNV